eukprot:TRINITY_DN5178_c0_g2_i1.p6 TRINITY_DN5178_c0_g2~~TRINITY_DN5178_c0_g2_i1.p6  ORF type:complete len:129 (+),score=4.04 TRINITY_DN5178_c0_g2_i1:659-1045(+)
MIELSFLFVCLIYFIKLLLKFYQLENLLISNLRLELLNMQCVRNYFKQVCSLYNVVGVIFFNIAIKKIVDVQSDNKRMCMFISVDVQQSCIQVLQKCYAAVDAGPNPHLRQQAVMTGGQVCVACACQL